MVVGLAIPAGRTVIVILFGARGAASANECAAGAMNR